MTAESLATVWSDDTESKTDREPRVYGAQNMIFTLAAAMRRGWSDGAAVVGTDYVFEEVARWLWTLRKVRTRFRHTLASLPDNAGASEGLSYRTDPADDVAVEARAVLREATWVARKRLSRDFAAPAPLWSDGVYMAVQRSLHLAMMVDVVHAGSRLLVTGCLSGNSNRAHQLLEERRLGSDGDASQDHENREEAHTKR